MKAKKYNLSSARIVGNLGGMADELQPLLGELHLNDTFSRADVQNVESLIKDKLGERGYGSATVNTGTNF